MRRRAALAALVACVALLACGAGRDVEGEQASGAFTPAPGPNLGSPALGGGLGADVGNRAASPPAFTLDPYRGLGAWLDVFDWSVAYAPNNRPTPTVDLSAIDDMANRGVRTLFIQTARYDNPADLLEPDRLRALIRRAHERHLAVVSWYLPTFEDLNVDFRRLMAPVALGVDGIAVDIEARVLPDVAERTRRLVELSRRLRDAVGPGPVLGAIVLPVTLIEDVNPNYWVGYPWVELGQNYNVFLPMNYWTNRLTSSPWRDAGASTAENIVRIRARTGRSDAPVHTIGGSAQGVTAEEVRAMAAANRAGGGIGASLYDYATTGGDLWPALAEIGVS